MDRRAAWQIALVLLACCASVFVARFSGEAAGYFIGLWHGAALLVFYFVLPVIVAVGYIGKHPWARTAHLVKAGGAAYGALSLVIPLAMGGLSVNWPLIVFLAFAVCADAFALASETRSTTG